MSAKTVHLSNLESRPVTFRGNSGESFHLAPLERDREVRLLEVEGNPAVDKLKQRRVLDVHAKSSPKAKKAAKTAKKTTKASTKKKTARSKSGPKSGPKTAAKSGSAG